MLPASRGASQRVCCSKLPKRMSNSILPVSGAEQLSASGASRPLLPVSSAKGAYSSVLRPSPGAFPPQTLAASRPNSGESQAFHRPSSLASRLSRSAVCSGCHRAPRCVLKASSAAASASAGSTRVATKASSWSYRQRTFGEKEHGSRSNGCAPPPPPASPPRATKTAPGAPLARAQPRAADWRKRAPASSAHALEAFPAIARASTPCWIAPRR
mmetsp:Transcript_13835/g.35206  ORF Transcript_13835/g.35206 Transcript_13835/m.35206 type:complete len:214 (-) Transcript_13835:141-782(-)